ncbi:unnamed protein product [marine sediment metagenome]|uniref:Uncharacterized protein n=1 Tax=marine sediment metagenome TaxID=412755 RepID=X1AY52_9ZZZZ
MINSNEEDIPLEVKAWRAWVNRILLKQKRILESYHEDINITMNEMAALRRVVKRMKDRYDPIG